MPPIAPAARSLPRSGIRELMDLATALGPGTLRLETGQPGRGTPAHISAAAARAADEGHTGYAPNAGIPELREAIAARLRRRHGSPVGPERIIVTAGATQGLHLIIAALAGPGDEVLVPDPGWPNYTMMALLHGSRPVPYPLRPGTGFLPRISDLEALINVHTRVLVLNSPSNPLGVALPAALVRDLLALARAHDFWVISDECYDELVFDGGFASPAAADPDGRTAGVYSFSKTYAMAGWRVGYVVLPEPLADIATALQEPFISSVNTPAQWAAVAALTGPQDGVAAARADYAANRATGLALCGAAGLPAHPPDGAFYLWLDISAAGMDSRAFAIELAKHSGVTVAPGTAFGSGGAGHIRVSLAAQPEQLTTGLGRLIDFWSRRAEERPRTRTC